MPALSQAFMQDKSGALGGKKVLFLVIFNHFSKVQDLTPEKKSIIAIIIISSFSGDISQAAASV